MKANGMFLLLTHVGAGVFGFLFADRLSDENFDTMITYFGWGWIAFAVMVAAIFSGLIISRKRELREDEMSMREPAQPPIFMPSMYGPTPMGQQFPVPEGAFNRSGTNESYGVSSGSEFR